MSGRCHRLSIALVLGLAAAGCPAQKPTPKSSATAPARDIDEKPHEIKGREVKSLKLPRSMIIGENVTLSGFFEDGETAGPPSPLFRPEAQAVAGPVGGQTTIYRQIAPATVIIATRGGYGTGVLYDEDGWILTNHHVVAQAAREDFRMRVTVTLGKLDERGVMQREPRSFRAYVHKVDALRDLAVLKLQMDTPEKLPAVTLAATDPVPGEAVYSLGHAGIGLLWAIKGGQIAAIGKLSTHLAELLLLDTARERQGSSETDEDNQDEARAEKLNELKKDLEKERPALVIQSTCDISQGDSGGPLVNQKGELVGLNAFIRGSMGSSKMSNFHIHVGEVRSFIETVPETAPQLVPDPWTQGGTLARLGDADLDAKLDVIVMYRLERLGIFSRQAPGCFFLDLDQNSIDEKSDLPDVRDVVTKRSFDAELVLLDDGSGEIYAWYDGDNDGRLDVLLLARTHRKGGVQGYRIDDKGLISADPTLDGTLLLRPELVTDAGQNARLLAMATRLFPASLLPPALKEVKQQVPDPLHGGGHQGSLKDLDGDGKPDALALEGLFSQGHVLDLDQDSLGTLSVKDTLGAVLRAGKLDAELSWIEQAGDRWVFYDADNDGRFELLLHSGRQAMDIVEDAWVLQADGQRQPAPGYLGRRLLQPGLFTQATLGAALKKAAKAMPQSALCSDGPLGCFPDPGGYFSWGTRLRDAGKATGIAAEVRVQGCTGLLVDLDRDTPRLAKRAGQTLEAMVAAHTFDAELAVVRCGPRAWAFYDTDGKGGYDQVLYLAGSEAGRLPDAVYQLTKDSRMVPRTLPFRCPGLVHPALFRSPMLRKALAKVGPEFFKPLPDSTCKP